MIWFVQIYLELALENSDSEIEFLSGFERIAQPLLVLGPIALLKGVVDEFPVADKADLDA